VWDAEPGCVHAGTLARTRRAVMISVSNGRRSLNEAGTWTLLRRSATGGRQRRMSKSGAAMRAGQVLS
jgi:hypothetical protein